VNILSTAITLIRLGTPPDHVFKLLREFSSNAIEILGQNLIKIGLPFTLLESHANGSFGVNSVISGALAMAT